MRTSMRRLALAAGAVLTLAGAGVAIAQVPPAPPAPPAPPPPPLPPLPPMEAMMLGGHDMMVMRHGKPADPEAHAKRLRDVLQLRPDQDGALKAYLEATAPQKTAEAMKWDSKDDDKAPLTTPERLDRQAAHMTKMAETFQKRAAATRAFYAALSPSQQKAFDALGPEAGGPRMIVKRFETRHEGGHDAGHGDGRKEERTIIMKRKAS